MKAGTLMPVVPRIPSWSTVKVVDGTSTRRTAVRDSVVTVASLWEQDAIWTFVAGRPWLPAPDREPMCGPEVVARLRPNDPLSHEYRIGTIGFWSFFGFPGETNAETTACGAILVNGPNVTEGTRFVNTIAHENTHTLGSGTGPLGCEPPSAKHVWAFQDGAYSNETKPWLVSYAFGDVAECFLETCGRQGRMEACFNRKINAADSCRRKDECCGEPSDSRDSKNRPQDSRAGGLVQGLQVRSGLPEPRVHPVANRVLWRRSAVEMRARPKSIKYLAGIVVCAASIACAGPRYLHDENSAHLENSPTFIHWHLVRTIPHPTSSYTEGLVFDGRALV